MSASSVQFSHEEFLAARKRYNLGIVDDESDGSGSSLESFRGDNEPLLSINHLSTTFVTPLEVLKRLGQSLIPPFHPSRILSKPPVDPIGPVLVITLLVTLLIYTSAKTPPFEYKPIEASLIIGSYVFFSSLFVFFMGRLLSCGRFQISFFQVMALLGYSLFGHLLSLLISYVLYTYPDPPNENNPAISNHGTIQSAASSLHRTTTATPSSFPRDYDDGSTLYAHASGNGEEIDSKRDVKKPSQWGDTAFFFSLALIAGPSTLRVVLILLSPIQSPPGRMILGTILCLSHLLLLVILHASFLHPTFQYGAKG